MLGVGEGWECMNDVGAYINRGAWEGALLYLAAPESYLSAGFQASCVPN